MKKTSPWILVSLILTLGAMFLLRHLIPSTEEKIMAPLKEQADAFLIEMEAGREEIQAEIDRRFEEEAARMEKIAMEAARAAHEAEAIAGKEPPEADIDDGEASAGEEKAAPAATLP